MMKLCALIPLLFAATVSMGQSPATQPAEMVITPGVGVGAITLGMNKEDVIKHLGKPDKIEGKGGFGLNYISSMGLSLLVSRSKGVVFISCWNSRATYWLHALSVKDFRGATDKGIKMGAGRDEIVRAYGKADSESGDAAMLYMDYRSQGIEFMLLYGKLVKIDVVEPNVFALIPATAFSQPATRPVTQPTTQPAVTAGTKPIPDLIEQLGSSKFKERQEAQEALVGIGPAALPGLRMALHDKDPERSTRAKQALESIQRYERIPDTVSQVFLKTYKLGKRAPIASGPLGIEDYLNDISTDGRIAELLEIAAKGSPAERGRLKEAVVAAMRKYVDELPDSIGPDEPWRPNARHTPGVFVCAYLLSSFDEQPAEMLDLLAQVLLRSQTASATYFKGSLKDFGGSQNGLILATACCHYLDLCQRDLGRKGALNTAQAKALEQYAAVKAASAGKGHPAEVEQVGVFRAAAAFALAGGNEKVRKLHDKWLAATAPARQKGEKLKGILPSGTEIELVGVSHYPDKNQPWWRPDGTRLDAPPVDPRDIDITSFIDPKVRKIELVFRLGGKADQPAYDSQIRRSDDEGVWWTGRRTRSGKFASDFKVIAINVPADSKTVWLDLLVAAGPWETVATCDGRQAKGPLSAATPGGRAGSEPSTVITARFDPDKKDAQVVGIDADGVKHIVRGFDIRKGDENAGANFLFQGLTPRQFKSFTLETRPNNELIHLTDISLVSGRLTDAQLIPAAPATQPAVRLKSMVGSELK